MTEGERHGDWFRDLAERTGDAFYAIRTDPDVAVEFVSETIAGHTGYAAAEYLADPGLLRRVIDPRDADKMAANLAAPPGAAIEVELRWVHRDGHEVWIQHWARRRLRADGSIVLEGTAHDVTPLRKAEEALAESLAQYRMLAEESSDFTVRTNPQGVIEWVSPSVTRVLGWLPEELVGHEALEFLHPDTLAQARVGRARMDAGEAVSGRGQFRCADGSYRWLSQVARSVLDHNGAVVAGVSGYQDVDAQVKAEQALADSEERYRRIADNVTDVIWVLDLDAGRFVYVSPSVERLRGYTPEEVLAQGMDEALTPESLRRVMEVLPATLAAFLAGETDVASTVELDQPRKDGSIVPTEVSTRFLTDADGRPRYVLGVTRDISERRAAEAALQQRVSDLDTLARLAALLVRHTDTDSAVDAACALLVEALEAQSAAVVPLPDEGSPGAAGLVTVRGARGGDAAEETAVAAALAAGEPVEAQCAGTGRLLAVPLIADAETLGVLVVIAAAGARAFARSEQAMVRAAADLLAAVLRSERLHRLETRAAAADERQRIARDLHDAVTQGIYSASLIADALPDLWQRDPVRARKELQAIRRLNRAALAELRILLYELRPDALATAPLEVLLERLADALAGQGEIDVDLAASPDLELPEPVRLTFYRVAQEALNNVGKYAQATRVSVVLAGDGEEVWLSVRDDGRGFDQATTTPGMGLGIMRERAAAVGAEVTVASEPGLGTTVEMVWSPAAMLTVSGQGP